VLRMLCCLKGWQQTLNCVGFVAEDPTRLLGGVMVLIWASVRTAFNTSSVFFPHKCFLWHHYLQKEVSKKAVQTMLRTVFQALTLQ